MTIITISAISILKSWHNETICLQNFTCFNTCVQAHTNHSSENIWTRRQSISCFVLLFFLFLFIIEKNRHFDIIYYSFQFTIFSLGFWSGRYGWGAFHYLVTSFWTQIKSCQKPALSFVLLESKITLRPPTQRLQKLMASYLG